MNQQFEWNIQNGCIKSDENNKLVGVISDRVESGQIEPEYGWTNLAIRCSTQFEISHINNSLINANQIMNETAQVETEHAYNQTLEQQHIKWNFFSK